MQCFFNRFTFLTEILTLHNNSKLIYCSITRKQKGYFCLFVIKWWNVEYKDHLNEENCFSTIFSWYKIFDRRPHPRHLESSSCAITSVELVCSMFFSPFGIHPTHVHRRASIHLLAQVCLDLISVCFFQRRLECLSWTLNISSFTSKWWIESWSRIAGQSDTRSIKHRSTITSALSCRANANGYNRLCC